MVPGRCSFIGEMMVCVHRAMIVSVAIGMRRHHDGQHVLGEARCRATAKRERHRRRDDAQQVDRSRDPPGRQPS
jgi:hypothetical protein